MSKAVIENWVRSVEDASRLLLPREEPHGWLIKQSIHTHFHRLIPLMSLACFKDISGDILDVGAGTGALSLDLAWRAGNGGLVTALDQDTEALKIAKTIAGQVGVKVATLAGDATAMPVQDASRDMTVARFLFQHLSDPLAVLCEMRRVTRPGGLIAIIDVDDEIMVSDPPEPQHITDFRKAIRTLQSLRGGDRLIGHRLYRLMREAGLEAIQVMVIPFVGLGLQQGRRPEIEAFKIERLLRERNELIASEIMTDQDFTAALSELQQGFAEDRFQMDADIVATGLVPAA
ncbi:MAG: methyltransferase domain-containing protein [Syntrophobacteraceae bacterium]|nr:methyltransferase domain-containing protein [Syntrophobacteraceae bacterium]